MNQLEYAYSVSYIRAIENKLLTKADIENLILTKTPKEAIQILIDKGYGSEYIPPEKFEELLSRQYMKCWNEVKEVAPDGKILDILLYKNDFHNLKVVLKGVNRGVTDYSKYILNPATVDYNIVISAVANNDFSLLPPMLRGTAEKAYDVLGRTSDSQLMDMLIDKASMDYTLSMALETKVTFLAELIKLQNTLTDIKIAFRCAKTEKSMDFIQNALSENSDIDREKLIKSSLSGTDAVLDYLAQSGFQDAGQTLKTSMAEFEKYYDDTVTDYIRKAKYITFGIEPLISYIQSKTIEIQSVRIIMTAKLNGFDEEQIRQRLRNFV